MSRRNESDRRIRTAEPRPDPAAPTAIEPAPAVPAVTAVAALTGVLFGSADADFPRLVAALIAELAPTTVVERLYVELATEALGRLRDVKRAEAGAEPGDPRTSRARGQATRDFHKAMSELSKLRRPPKPEPRRRRDEDEVEDAEPEPAPEVPVGPEPDITEPHPDWRSRIVLDPAYSTKWPIIKGTTIEVEDVMGGLSDKHPPSRLLRAFPGLTVEDIRACLACDAAGKCGPFQPWDPPDAFERDGPIEPRAYPRDLDPIPKTE